jgi:hypothetical protein
MFLYLGIGTVLLGLAGFLCLVCRIGQYNVLAGKIGILSWVIAIILSGSLALGERTRANYSYAEEAVARRRRRWAVNLFMVGLPSMLAVVIYYFLKVH